MSGQQFNQYPMMQQNPLFYQNPNQPNPINLNQSSQNFQSFNNAFAPMPQIPFNGYDPKSQFKNNNFVNPGTLLHNNLNNILLNEEIREYSVLIDSKDRNYQVFPNPFEYTVTFKPLNSSMGFDENGKKIKYEVPNPVISDNFENVRYIKLEDIILPIYNKSCMVPGLDDDYARPESPNDVYHEIDGKKYRIKFTEKIDAQKNLINNNLYVLLSLGRNFQDINYKSTNGVLEDSFAAIYYDYRTNDTHYMGYSRNGIKIYEQDQLGRIDKLDIKFTDPYGKPLTVDHIDRTIKSNPVCLCDDKDDGDLDNDCYIHNIKHPMNPIYQHHIHLKVGVVEPRLNKKTFA